MKSVAKHFGGPRKWALPEAWGNLKSVAAHARDRKRKEAIAARRSNGVGFPRIAKAEGVDSVQDRQHGGAGFGLQLGAIVDNGIKHFFKPFEGGEGAGSVEVVKDGGQSEADGCEGLIEVCHGNCDLCTREFAA